MKRVIFTEINITENEVLLKDLNNESIVCIEYEQCKGLVLNTNESEFKAFTPYHNTDLRKSYSETSLIKYLEESRETDISYKSCYLFENMKDALNYLNS